MLRYIRYPLEFVVSTRFERGRVSTIPTWLACKESSRSIVTAAEFRSVCQTKIQFAKYLLLTTSNRRSWRNLRRFAFVWSPNIEGCKAEYRRTRTTPMSDASMSFLFTHDDEELRCDGCQFGENSFHMTKTERFFPEIHRRRCFSEIRRFIVRAGEIRLGRCSVVGTAEDARDERFHLCRETRVVRFGCIAAIDKDEQHQKRDEDEKRNRTLTKIRRSKTRRKEKTKCRWKQSRRNTKQDKSKGRSWLVWRREETLRTYKIDMIVRMDVLRRDEEKNEEIFCFLLVK